MTRGYIDESGRFEAGEDGLVAALVVKAPEDEERWRRDTLTRRYPWLPWPWHSTHLRRPGFLVACWLEHHDRTGRQPESGEQSFHREAQQAAERAPEALRPLVDALSRGREPRWDAARQFEAAAWPSKTPRPVRDQVERVLRDVNRALEELSGTWGFAVLREGMPGEVEDSYLELLGELFAIPAWRRLALERLRVQSRRVAVGGRQRELEEGDLERLLEEAGVEPLPELRVEERHHPDLPLGHVLVDRLANRLFGSVRDPKRAVRLLWDDFRLPVRILDSVEGLATLEAKGVP